MTRKLAAPSKCAILGIASLVFAGLSTRVARADDAPPAPAPAPAATDAPKPEDEEAAKKKKLADAPTEGTPAPTGAAAPVSASGSVTVTIGSSEGETKKDEVTKEAKPAEDEAKKKKSPWRGTLILFDQSMTTNSFSKGSQLSPSPLYEWWVSPRIAYWVGDHVKLGARFDFFKEMFTNHEETTDSREWRYGDPWLTANYSDEAKFINKNPKTRWAVGVTLRPPMSKESRANGQYFAFGPGASLTVGYDIRGEKAKSFQGGSVGISASYSHAFTKYTTASPFSDFCRPGTDINGSNLSCNDQLRSGTLSGNTLIYALSAGLDIVENLEFGASFIYINQFSYQPTDASFGGTTIERSPNDTRFRQLSWYLFSLDYDPIKEVSVGIGYYNLNTVIGLDGKYRNPFWSPDARVFLGVTAHLDAIYDTLTNKKKEEPKTASHVQKLMMYR